jgi:pimeloyl-ACP methyl ester carboxylesterase
MKEKSADLMNKSKCKLDKQANMTSTEYHNFRTAEARAEYFAALDVREKRWPILSENRFFETSWAKTFVRIGGPIGAPPLVLIHGMAGNSLSWEPNIKALSEHFRTYAMDNPYDIGGRSVYIRDVKNLDDYMSWMDETFMMLGLSDNINIVGISFSAWLNAQYAMRCPDRLAKVVLLSPGLVVQNARFIWVFRFLLSMLNPSFSGRFAQWFSKDAYIKGPYYKQLVEDVANDALMLSGKCIPRRAVRLTKLKNEEWKRITTPMLILAGEHEKIYHPAKAIMHMKRVAPHVKMEVIGGAGHDLPITQREIVNQKMIEFFSGRNIGNK